MSGIINYNKPCTLKSYAAYKGPYKLIESLTPQNRYCSDFKLDPEDLEEVEQLEHIAGIPENYRISLTFWGDIMRIRKGLKGLSDFKTECSSLYGETAQSVDNEKNRRYRRMMKINATHN